MVSLRYHDEGFIDTFDRQIRALSEVQECYHMAGKVDFFFKNKPSEFRRLSRICETQTI